MMKFFRKYTKQMLAVFLALLLIVWLGGEALEQFLQPNPEKTVLAYAYGEKIRGGNLNRATAETRILRSLFGMVGLRPWVHLGSGFRGPLMALKELDPMDWLLLRQEANRANVPVTDGEVDELLEGMDGQRIARHQIQESLYVGDAEIRSAVADYLKVVKLGRLVGSSAQVSEAELKHAVADMEEKAEIRMVLLASEKLKDASGEIRQEDLDKQFAEYRDKMPNTGKYGFGYMYPERVKIQYMSVNAKALAERVRVTEQQARAFWKENQQAAVFERPKSSTQPATASAPTTTQATSQEGPKYFTSFVEAKEAALKHLRTEKAKEEAHAKLVEILGEILSVDFSAATEGKDGYRTAPATVKDPNYWTTVYERAKRNKQIEGLLEKHEPERLLSREELEKLPGIGGAKVPSAGRGEEIPLSELAFQVQGLTAIPQGENVDRSHYLSLYEAFPSPVTDAEGNAYIFRVIQAEKPQPPQTLAEVEEKVRQDLVILRAHEKTGQLAERIAKEAKEASLEAAWSDEAELKKQEGPDFGYLTPRPFSRKGWGASVPGIGMNETFTDAVFALAASHPNAQAEKVRVVELPLVKKWAVVEYVQLNPTARDRYERLKLMLREQLASQKRDELLSEWFSVENIRQRANYSVARDEEEQQGEEEPKS